MQFGFIFALIVSILIAIFAVQNADAVQIDLFFATYNISQAIVILVSTAFGAIVAAILGSVRIFKNKAGTKELKNKIKMLETEKSQLTNDLNIKDSDLEALQSQKDEYKENCEKLAVELDDKEQIIKDLNISLLNYKSEVTDNSLIENKVTDNSAYLEDDNEKSEA